MTPPAYIHGLGLRAAIGDLAAAARAVRGEAPTPDGAGPLRAPGDPGDTPRALWLATAAAADALAEAGPGDPARTAVVVGTSQAMLDVGLPLYTDTPADAPARLAAHRPGALAEQLADALGLGGPTLTVGMACVSGAVAVVEAMRLLAAGHADRVLCGGVDADDPFIADGFRALGAHSPGALRPFDTERDGTRVGEAAAFIVLDRRPGPTGLAVLGGGCSADGVHPTAPDRTGGGLARAITAALGASGGAHAIDAICAHGTATPYNDPMECAAFEAVFGPAPPPIFAAKGWFGHTLGAAGAVDLIWSALALRHQHLPATAGLTHPIRPAPWDFCPTGRPAELRAVLSCNAAFMGQNSALVVARMPSDAIAQMPSMPSMPSAMPSGPLRAPADAPALVASAHRASPRAVGAPLPDVEHRHPAVSRKRHGYLMGPFDRLAAQVVGDVVAAMAPADRADGMIALGTAWGCHAANADYMAQRSDPAAAGRSFAATVHNSAAGWAAIRYGIKGPNLTLCSGLGADLEAIAAAADAVAAGRATFAIAGGVDVPPVQWTRWLGAVDDAAAVVGLARAPDRKGPRVLGLVRAARDPDAALTAALEAVGLDAAPVVRDVDDVRAMGAAATRALIEAIAEGEDGVVVIRAHPRDHLMLVIWRG